MKYWERAFYDAAKEMKMMMVSYNDNHPCGGSHASRNLEEACNDFCREIEKNDAD